MCSVPKGPYEVMVSSMEQRSTRTGHSQDTRVYSMVEAMVCINYYYMFIHMLYRIFDTEWQCGIDWLLLFIFLKTIRSLPSSMSNGSFCTATNSKNINLNWLDLLNILNLKCNNHCLSNPHLSKGIWSVGRLPMRKFIVHDLYLDKETSLHDLESKRKRKIS